MPEHPSGSASFSGGSSSAGAPAVQHQHPPPFLRRCSISEPHLDIVPHFLKEEKSFNPFNRVLSGLFDKGSTFSVNSTDSVDQLNNGGAGGHLFSSKSDRHDHFATAPPQLTKGNSAIGMSSFVPMSGAPLSDSLRKSATSTSALYNSSTAPHHFPTIPEVEGQGLTMSAGRRMLSADKAMSPAKGDTAGMPLAASPPNKSGLMGFFSRPVLHSPEENYRLIMALDR